MTVNILTPGHRQAQGKLLLWLEKLNKLEIVTFYFLIFSRINLVLIKVDLCLQLNGPNI